jgi:hypothetical protein
MVKLLLSSDMTDLNDLPVGTELEAKYIPLSSVIDHQKDGWDVTTLDGNHGAYSALATRIVKEGNHDR